ncbi:MULTISPECIES: ATP synthase F1 subunit delta [Pedobacter]|jgi:F-type H+-transporting ATPase subunit delta|uniref:ATP synthase F1 subunit delta n=1 Tax=Pedobacter TaxID=84567 RepID=UPI000E24FB8A|nr:MULTISPECIES: ATP synthase F1 subunit delta [Pedobacter]AZI25346.1 ATP synthase F1 subunit delta [Pedobacter sp. G11]MDQ1141341.1 F-type H+-transporting ATPase subunit delta [Pedobacter agri]
MSEIKVAGRYAKSLIDLAVENNGLAESYNDMVLFEKVVDETPELEAILKNPIVPLDKKVGILNGIFGDKVGQLSLTFFKTVVNKGRSAILFATAKQFIKQYNEIKGIVTADVTSATALSAEAKAQIIETVKKELGAKEVIVNEKIDEKLIGGFILKVGDKQFDASIASGLNKLKKEFAA